MHPPAEAEDRQPDRREGAGHLPEGCLTRVGRTREHAMLNHRLSSAKASPSQSLKDGRSSGTHFSTSHKSAPARKRSRGEQFLGISQMR